MKVSTEHNLNEKSFLPSPDHTSALAGHLGESGEMKNVINVISSTCAEVYMSTGRQEIAFPPEGDLTIYVQKYFSFTYTLLMTPFKLGKDRYGNVCIKKWPLQQMLCGFMNILSIIRIITEIRLGIRDLQAKVRPTPVEYFENVMNFFSLAYKTATMNTFWFHQNRYLEIVTVSMKKVQSFSRNRIHKKLYLKPWIVSGVFVILLLQCFVNLAAGKNFIVHVWNWSPTLWVTRMVELARYTFFLEQNLQRKTISSNSTSSHSISPLDGILGIVMVLGMFQRQYIMLTILACAYSLHKWIFTKNFLNYPRYVQGFFCDLCIFSCAMTLWLHANAFAQVIVQYPKKLGKTSSGEREIILEPWAKVYEHFRAMQKLSLIINKAIGTQVTLYIAESVMYYSLNLNAVMSIKNVFRKIDMICFYILTFLTFIFAADVGNQMESVKSWIAHGNNRFKIPYEEMNIVLHEMLAKDVGIRGSNVFTVTYQFLAAVLSTTVTIFIISVQSNDKDGTDESYLSFHESKPN